MDRIEIISKISEHVKSKQLGETTGHDWWHTYRVWGLAKKIAQVEGADLYIVELSALLHDLDDWKFSANDDSSAEPAKVMLELGVEKEVSEHVCDIIRHLSFKGAGVDSAMTTIEGKVVQDADRLDALGASELRGLLLTVVIKGEKFIIRKLSLNFMMRLSNTKTASARLLIIFTKNYFCSRI
jgi:uncharacterized protein